MFKLSELIEVGCRGTVQGFDNYFPDYKDTSCCCVLGAAAVGYYRLLNDTEALIPEGYDGDLSRFLEDYEELLDSNSANPVTGKENPLAVVCSGLNDDQRWSREGIGQWLYGQGL